MSKGLLGDLTDTGFSVIAKKDGKVVPKRNPGESTADYVARINAPKVPRKQPQQSPYASVEKAIERFAKRKMKGGYKADQCVIYIEACGDDAVMVEAKPQTETDDLIEVFVTVTAAEWSAAFVATKFKAPNKRLWSAGAVDVLKIAMDTPPNFGAVVAWLDAA